MQAVPLSMLASATRGEVVGGNASRCFQQVETDSRRVQPGDLFWALRGEHHDGHDFVAQVRQLGAAAAVVSRTWLLQATEARPVGTEDCGQTTLIAVDDTLQALTDFASWNRSQSEALVIGVTGSFGKTTTREMIHAVLSAAHLGVRSLKNFNNHIGLPLSLLELDAGHEFAVLEMGASAVGEIAKLANIARPEVGVITGIGLAHVAGFGSPERIIQGKGELLEALPASGFAILPGDDPTTRDMSSRARCPVIFVGEQEHNHVRAMNVSLANQRLNFTVAGVEYSVPVAGRHFLRAALTALAMAREIGMKPADISAGFQNFQAAPGRCQVQQIGPWTVIDDSYNANPASMQAACQTLRDWQSGRHKLLVAGDMLELGDLAARSHFEFGRAAAHAHVDALLAFGSQAENVIRGARDGGLPLNRLAQCDHFETLLTALDCVIEPDDVVLVKGSRGMRMERVVDWLKAKSQESGVRSQSISQLVT